MHGFQVANKLLILMHLSSKSHGWNLLAMTGLSMMFKVEKKMIDLG
jgi:hypothetical protein